jgi:uncharacterized protein (TIGR03437 family)
MRRRCSIVLLAAFAAHGQFRELAVTDDGAQIYFYSDLKLKATPDRQGGIYRIVRGRLELIQEAPPPPTDLVAMLRPQSIGQPQVSGDGQVVAYTRTYGCQGGSSCDFAGYPNYYSYVSVRGEWLAEPLGGRAQVSRNGRYVLHTGFWSIMGNPPTVFRFRHLRDLQTGEETEAPIWPCYDCRAVTSDGRVLGSDPEQSGVLMLWSRQGLRRLAVSEAPGRALINDAGTWVIYETGSLWAKRLRSLELSTGRDILLADTWWDPQVSISNDGALVAYLSGSGRGPSGQIALARPDGTGTRQLGAIPEGVAGAVLAGSGTAVVAVTDHGRMVRVGVESGSVEELIPRTPVYRLESTALIPGSILPVRGSGLARSTRLAPYPLPRELEGVRFLVGDEPMPLLSVSPTEIWFQVPFEMEAPGGPLRYELENSSVFEGGSGSIRVARRRPYFFSDDKSGDLVLAHEDFRSVVGRNNRARPEEVVHAYAVGLGPVAPEMTTGVPTPTDRLFRLVDDFDCRVGTQPLEVLFAGLAPGMIGIYQVSVRMPKVGPSESFLLSCGFPDNPWDRHGGIVPFGWQAPPAPGGK